MYFLPNLPLLVTAVRHEPARFQTGRADAISWDILPLTLLPTNRCVIYRRQSSAPVAAEDGPGAAGGSPNHCRTPPPLEGLEPEGRGERLLGRAGCSLARACLMPPPLTGLGAIA